MTISKDGWFLGFMYVLAACLFALSIVMLLNGCGSNPPLVSLEDEDAGIDAGIDSGVDAGEEDGQDAGCKWPGKSQGHGKGLFKHCR